MKKMILIICFVIGIMQHGYPQTNNYLHFSATTSQIALLITVTSGVTYENLEPGMAYRTVAAIDPSGINITRFNGEEIFTPAQIEIEGAPNSEVIVTVLLPTRLQPTEDNVGYIEMMYDNQSASVFDPLTGQLKFFNPLSGTILMLPGSGESAIIYLGGNPTVLPPATYGEFLGTGIIIVEYS